MIEAILPANASGDLTPPADPAAQLAVVPEPGEEGDDSGKDYQTPPPPPPMPPPSPHGGYQAPAPPARFMVSESRIVTGFCPFSARCCKFVGAAP